MIKFQLLKLFKVEMVWISSIGYWNLFVIWSLLFGAFFF